VFGTPILASAGRALGRADPKRVAELGKMITADYASRPATVGGVLKGAFMFLADLAREIQLPLELDFMAVSSYGGPQRPVGRADTQGPRHRISPVVTSS